MKTVYKKVFFLLFVVPMLLNAEGLGVYIPFSVYTQSDVSVDVVDSVTNGRDVKADYAPSLGLGVMYDTNVGENKLMNYRVGLEYMKLDVDSVDGSSSDQSGSRIDLTGTIGFGVIRGENLRLWVGPRMNFAWNDEVGGVKKTDGAYEIGIGVALGINVELSRDLVMGADIDYREALLWGDTGSGKSFHGDIEGATARLSLIYMFGETFPKPMQ